VPEYNPKIVGFLCNWCGYAGADLAGTSRLSYPTNIRIIRVMCSGRVEPVFILNAFENGADGVLVAGCHPGDCHYRSGNQHAEKRIDKTKKLLDLLGIGSDRLRLEWISAAEGEKFASVIKDFTEKLRSKGPSQIGKEAHLVPLQPNEVESVHDLLKRTKALYCQECGKCSSSCPITRLDPAYSPRLAVEKALMGLEDTVLTDKGLWSCLTCYLCRQRCPLDIEYDELIRSCRAKAATKGIFGKCSHEGVLHSLSRLMANPKTKQNRLGWIPQEAEIAKNYMLETELRQLYLLVEQFLAYAEFQIERKNVMYMKDWVSYLDNMLQTNKLKILASKGKISHKEMEKIVRKEIAKFNSKNKRLKT